MAETGFGKLVDELIGATNKYVILETEDGVQREGRLTNWHTIKVNFNNTPVLFPSALELNGDPMDTVDLARIKRLTVKQQ